MTLCNKVWNKSIQHVYLHLSTLSFHLNFLQRQRIVYIKNFLNHLLPAQSSFELIVSLFITFLLLTCLLFCSISLWQVVALTNITKCRRHYIIYKLSFPSKQQGNIKNERDILLLHTFMSLAWSNVACYFKTNLNFVQNIISR